MLYLNEPRLRFCDMFVDLKRAHFVIVGIPLDSTVSRVHGTRFAPENIRKASMHLESYSLKFDIDFEKLSVCDLGDIVVYDFDPMKSIDIIEKTLAEVLDKSKVVVAIGGEHLITLPMVKVFSKYYHDLALLVFDAHLDLRDEYPLGYKYTHATVVRRIAELKEVNKILIVGVRGVSTEELEFVEKVEKLDFINIYTPLREVLSKIRDFINKTEKIYISIDTDVLDPSVAPGVGNPEPGGYSFREFFEILHTAISNKIVGFDIVEVYPPYDINNVTSLVAARLIYELISGIYKNRFR